MLCVYPSVQVQLSLKQNDRCVEVCVHSGEQNGFCSGWDVESGGGFLYSPKNDDSCFDYASISNNESKSRMTYRNV